MILPNPHFLVIPDTPTGRPRVLKISHFHVVLDNVVGVFTYKIFKTKHQIGTCIQNML